MAVFLGCSGSVELTRGSVGEVFTSVVNTSDVNPRRNHFSFDFPGGLLLTGDQVEIMATDGLPLDFVVDWPHPDGKWFIHVDEVGSIRLYDRFDDAVDGEPTNRVDVQVPDRPVPIEVRVANAVPRILGQVQTYTLNTSRDAVDVTELGEEFRQQYATLISGSGSMEVFFDYATPPCGIDGQRTELAIYLHQLVLRQRLGSSLHARLFLVQRGSGHDQEDELWYEFDAMVTNVVSAFEPTQPIRSSIQFVTTGEIRLRVRTTGSLLLQENNSRLTLEQGDGTGYVALEQES